MKIQDLAEWLRNVDFAENKDKENAKLAANYLDALESSIDEIDYQICICRSEIVKLTLDHVRSGIIQKHLNEAKSVE